MSTEHADDDHEVWHDHHNGGSAMATQSRVYVVFSDGQPAALVRARSQSEAIRHVTANLYEAVVADQSALITHLGAGMKVETAAADAGA